MRVFQSLLKSKYNSNVNRYFANVGLAKKTSFTNAKKKISNGLIKRNFSTAFGNGPNKNNDQNEMMLLLYLGIIYLCTIGRTNKK